MAISDTSIFLFLFAILIIRKCDSIFLAIQHFMMYRFPSEKPDNW